MKNEVGPSAHTPWRPGRRQIDMKDRAHDCIFGPTSKITDFFGVMDCSALSADLIIRKIMQDSKE